VGAAFSRDLPGHSRLKTAPTIQKQPIQNHKVSSMIILDARGQRLRLYETSFQKLELVLSWATLHFVGWVELIPGFSGFLSGGGPTYILPVLLRNAKPNNGRFRDQALKVSMSIKLAVFLANGGAET